MSLKDFQSWPIEKLVPHARPMLLLDRVAEITDTWIECEVTLTPTSEFCVDGRVGAWVGLEYMAQTVAALAGAQGLDTGHNIRVGLLLGTRSFTAAVPYFEVGVTLRVRATEVVFDPQGLSVVDCALRDAATGRELAQAGLTVYQVDDLYAYLQSLKK